MVKMIKGMAVAALLAVSAMPARADILWNWNWVFDISREQPLPDLPVFGGQLVTNDGNGNGTYTITSITGSWGLESITGLIAPNGFRGNSNLLYDVPPMLDFDGVSFTTATQSVNIYYLTFAQPDSLGGAALDIPCCYQASNQDEVGGSGTFDASPAPEPASMALLLGGIAGLGALRRRR